MELKKLGCELSVCRIRSIKDADLTCAPCFFARTDEELSLVVRTELAPVNAEAREDGWLGFCIEGELDFSLIGILSKISAILAENGIGIFAVSTFNTDYILTKKENFDRAMSCLEKAGYTVK